MALIAKATTVTGSPERQIITDLTPGRTRPYNNPLASTLPAFLLPAAIGLVAGAIWGRSSKPNEELARLNSEKTEAAITKDEAQASKAQAEADAITAGISDPRGLSREVAENIAQRKIGLEEANADRVQQVFNEERDFRENQREGQSALQQERLRGLQLENDKRAEEVARSFDQRQVANEKAALEGNTLYTVNQLLSEQLYAAIEARGARTAAAGAITPTPAAPHITAIGPGLASGFRISR